MNNKLTTYHFGSADETTSFGASLAQELSASETIGLTGPLGAGKTHLVRALVAGLGGDAKKVASPSFTLQYEYALPEGRLLEHWDLYRVDALPLELYEPPAIGVIRVIEWWEKFAELERTLTRKIRFSIVDQDSRSVTMDVCGGTV